MQALSLARRLVFQHFFGFPFSRAGAWLSSFRSRAWMLARRRSLRYLRSTRSMKAERDCFDPASRSTVVNRSLDSVIEVLSYLWLAERFQFESVCRKRIHREFQSFGPPPLW